MARLGQTSRNAGDVANRRPCRSDPEASSEDCQFDLGRNKGLSNDDFRFDIGRNTLRRVGLVELVVDWAMVSSDDCESGQPVEQHQEGADHCGGTRRGVLRRSDGIHNAPIYDCDLGNHVRSVLAATEVCGTATRHRP